MKFWCGLVSWMKKKLRKSGCLIKSINPDVKIIKCWDVFLVVLSYINFFIFTIEICFFSEDNSSGTLSSFSLIFPIKYMNFFCYGLDICLNFFTGYYYGGRVIMEPNDIRCNYLKNLFFFDILAYIPNVLYLFEDRLTKVSKKFYMFDIFFVFILKKYNQRLKTFKEFLIQEQEDLESWFSISVLYLRTFFISHILACLWYLIGTYNYTSQTTWVSYYNFTTIDWESKYLNSLYWSLVTMVTVGYGDIVPQNNLEKIFCIITIVIGFTIFGFTLGSFGDIIHKMNAKNQEL